MQLYDPLFDRAVQFAAKQHLNQHRRLPKHDPPPYISHPATLALILARAGFSSEVLAAAVLHDVVEDSDTTVDDLRDLFGPRVATLVAHVTEPPKSQPWEDRKNAYLHTLRTAASPQALAVATADKIHNLRSLHNEAQRLQETEGTSASIWSAFSRGRERSLWFYNEVLQILHDRSGEDARLKPLREELEVALRLVQNQADSSETQP